MLADLQRLTGAVALPFFTGLGVLAGPMVALVFGPGWEGAAPVLGALAAMGVYICLARVQVSWCLAAGRAGAISVLAWAVTGLMAGLMWVLSDLGIVAVALGVVGAHLALWPFYYRVIGRIGGGDVGRLVTCHAAPVLGALLMGAAVRATALGMAEARPLVILAVAVPVGVLVYGAFAWVLMRDRIALVMRLMRGQGE